MIRNKVLIYTRGNIADSAVTHNQFVANSRLKSVSAGGGEGRMKKRKKPYTVLSGTTVFFF